jgi:hypothetical protein
VGLVPDIDAQNVVEALVDRAHLHHGREGRHDLAQDREAALAEAFAGPGRERNPVLGAEREADRDREVVDIARRLQLGNDREGVLQRVAQVEQQPFAGAVDMREWAHRIDGVAALAVW